MTEEDEIPVAAICRLRRLMESAIEEEAWDSVANMAKEVCRQIRLALNPSTSQTGKVHLDGVYNVGTMRYQDAPKKAKKALDKMNRIIKTAKGTLR